MASGYSIFRLLKEAWRGNRHWTPAWRDAAPQPAYDAVIVGGGGHGLGPAFSHATGHGLGLEIHEEPRVGPRRADVPGVPPAGRDDRLRARCGVHRRARRVPAWFRRRAHRRRRAGDGKRGRMLTDVPRELQVV